MKRFTLLAAAIILMTPVLLLAAEAMDEDEKKEWLDSENEDQKKLRTELSELTKKGHRIYFNSNKTGDNEIYVINPDGTRLKRLTDCPANDVWPHMSPDGNWLAWQSNRPLSTEQKKRLEKLLERKLKVTDLRAINKGGITHIRKADGSEERLAMLDCPKWSWDGKRIAGQGGRIYDFENEKFYHMKLTFKTNKHHPTWTADNSHIGYCNGPLVMVKLNESRTGMAEGAKYFNTFIGGTCNVEFSRDGKYVIGVVDTYKGGGSWLKYAAMRDASHAGGARSLKMPHEGKTVNYYPDISPASKYVVYSHGPASAKKSWLHKGGLDLWIVRFPQGGTEVRITFSNAGVYNPHWWGPPDAK
jgi:hypothetical protein